MIIRINLDLVLCRFLIEKYLCKLNDVFKRVDGRVVYYNLYKLFLEGEFCIKI